jgi:hypothetical protein
MSTATVILRSGVEIPLKQWQESYGLKPYSNQIGKHFSIGERSISDKCKFSELLILVMDETREQWGKSLSLNSFDRTKAKQQELIKEGYRAAANSTHEWALAVDIDTTSNGETDKLVALIEQVSSKLNIKVRIGWQDYKSKGQTFVHVDVGPEYFAKGKPYYMMKFPAPWATEARW